MKDLLVRIVIMGTAAAIVLLASCSRRTKMQTLDFSSCVSALTNLAHFADTPTGNLNLKSTYDRTDGNQDYWQDYWNLSAPDPDGLYTIVSVKGPGCVKRIWQTSVSAEEYFFFLDGEKTARLRLKSSELFGDGDLFKYPLAGLVSAGSYCYVPIPFAKSLRLAVSLPRVPRPGDMRFYQINYDLYDRLLPVESFPKKINVPQKELLVQARVVWATKDEGAKECVDACLHTTNVVVPAGQNVEWLRQDTPGVLRTFWIQMSDEAESTACTRSKRLREVVLRIYWDGMREPSVDVPIGDFFCNGLHRRRFSSLPISVLQDALVCRFPMPFRKSVRVELRNDGERPVSIKAGWDIRPLAPATDRDLNYFHACWNSSASSGVPHRVLRAEGKGHYVGCYLIALGIDGTWNLLEGDDVAYLNGEQYPSLHGTGLEDYFNGAWYYSGLFDLPLHGLVEKAAMRTCQYRFHLSDPVVFQNGFLMIWEFGADSRNFGKGYMSSVAYWYQPEPHPAGVQLPDLAHRYPLPDPLELPTAMAGLFELERIAHYDEAGEMCRYFAEKFVNTEWAPVFHLRAAAYRELIDGFQAARPEYEAIAQKMPDSPAGQQARALLWFHEAATNALLAAHANMEVQLYLDGQAVGIGRDPFSLLVFPVTVTPGEHEIEAEVTPLCPGPWASFYLRAHTTNIVSDGTWECSQTRPTNWPHTGDPSVTWTNVLHAYGDVPKIAWWQFVPNAFINMQNGGRIIEIAWDGWGKQPFVTTYLRKRFVVR